MKNGHQKKRSSLSEIPLQFTRSGGHISSFSTASSLSRQPLPGRGYAALSTRSPSPPASSYFSEANGNDAPTATKNASSHFAYSTTLRRHHGESSLPLHTSVGSGSTLHSLEQLVNKGGTELWDRVVSTVAGRSSTDYRVEEGRMNGNANGLAVDNVQETPSSIHAHLSVEVRITHHTPQCLCSNIYLGYSQSISYVS